MIDTQIVTYEMIELRDVVQSFFVLLNKKTLLFISPLNMSIEQKCFLILLKSGSYMLLIFKVLYNHHRL